MLDAQTVLRGEDICLDIGQRRILSDINITLNSNSITTVIGPNGCGKSTLMRVLLGLIKPTSGHIEKKPTLRIGYMPQKLAINAHMPLSVIDFLRLSRVGNKHQSEHLLDMLNITRLKQSSVHALSGGEWQRVLLARALLANPELLVMDEPAQGIDVQGQSELYALIPELKDAFKCAVLMVSHDLHLVMKATDHVICLNQHICCEGHPDHVTLAPEYQALFPNMDTYTHHHNHTHPDSTLNTAKGGL